MKVEIIGDNRLGITQEVLADIASYHLDLAAVEVITHHIYIDMPDLAREELSTITASLLKIEGIRQTKEIDLLPDERRRLHLDALLSTLPDPVFSIDAKGKVLSANSAATTPFNLKESELIGRPINELLEGDIDDILRLSKSDTPRTREVRLAGQSYLLDVKPIYQINADTTPIGSMLLLHAAPRLGSHISSVQMGENAGFDSIVGESPAIKLVIEQASSFAQINAPLLIQGDTGTGKELFARAVHQTGPWHSAAFLALNCAALPESLVESELFGYEPGAFSGATSSGKLGLFELTDGGTVFLDEIGEMSPYVQAKLLRFLEDGSFHRVGGKEERKVNVRVICATHRDLEQMVAEGQFREDLMYRLAVLTLTLPPLSKYKEDIPLLIERFVTRAATQIGCAKPHLSEEALSILTNHPWPGNVRELQNTLFRTVAITQQGVIGPLELSKANISTQLNAGDSEPESWKTAVAGFEKDLLSRLYKHYPSTRKLARRLGVSHTTIADKLRVYGIAS